MSVFAPLFYRMLHFAGISSPREFATEEDREVIMESYRGLEMRDGARECIGILREGGWTVWAFTAGDLGRVGGYFREAYVFFCPFFLCFFLGDGRDVGIDGC